MPTIFSKIFSRKKLVFFALFVVFSVIFFSLNFKTAWAADDCSFNSGGWLNLGVGDAVRNGFAALFDGIGWLFKGLAQLSAAVLDNVLAKVTNAGWPITNPGATTDTAAAATARTFVSGWITMRDLANMLVVLGFVVVGIATALRLRDYEAQKLLLPLIITALLINFSGLLVGVITDVSNILMKGLLQGQGGLPAVNASIAGSLVKKIETSSNTIICANTAGEGSLAGYIHSTIFFSFIYLFFALTFLYLGVILIARYAILGLLFILAPLAFVMRTFPFPAAKDIWNKWWTQLIKWTFIGVGACFVLNLVSGMIQALGIDTKLAATKGDDFSIFFPLSIVLLTLVIGIKMTTKGAGMASNFVSGALGAMATGGLGAAKFLGKGALNKTGLSRVGSAVKDKTTSTLENMGLLQQGYTKNAQQKRLDRAKGMESKYEDTEQGNRQLSEIAQGRGVGGGMGPQAAEYRAKAAEILAKRNKLDFIPKEKQASAVAHARAMGVSAEAFKENKEVLAEAEAQQGVMGSLKRAGEAASTTLGAKAVAGTVKAVAHPQKTAKAVGGAIAGAAKATAGAVAHPLRDSLTTEARERLMEEEVIRLEDMGMPTEQAKDSAAKNFKPTQTMIDNARRQVVEAKAKQSKIGYSVVTNEDINKELQKQGVVNPTVKQTKETRDRLTSKKIQERLLQFTSATKEEARNKRIDDYMKTLKSTPGMTGPQIDREINRYAGAITASDIEDTQKNLNQEKIQKSLSKLSPGEAVKKISKEAITEDTLPFFTKKQLSEIGKRGTPEVIEEIKKFLPNRTIPLNDPGQPEEYQKIRRLAASYPAGSKERKRINSILNVLRTDPNFK